MNGNDIFISYRRDGGYQTAKHIHDLLVRDGYSVSFDMDTFRGGPFDSQILKCIDDCEDFVIIIDPHAFDRTVDPSFNPENDWMRQELAYALLLDKNVIPLLLFGARFPDNLPDDIKKVATMNGPAYSQSYFDTFYAKLKGFLRSSPRISMANMSGAAISLYSDTDCIVKEAGRFLAEVSAEDGASITLRKGRHRLIFVNKDDPEDRRQVDYEVVDVEMSDVIDVSFGQIVDQDKPGTFVSAEKTAEDLFNEAVDYDKQEEFGRSFELFKKAAEMGYDKAQNSLGVAYLYGEGVEQDDDLAVVWFRKAAEQGNAIAQYNLGERYELGEGVRKNLKSAYKWYNLSAMQGYAPGQVGLGCCYYLGEGVEEDEREAYYWFKKAAEQEYAEGQYWLGLCHQLGIDGLIRKNKREAIRWYMMAANQGYKLAQEKLDELGV